jgi:hypothetical protein
MRRALLGLLVAATSCSDFSLVAPEPAPEQTAPIMSVLVDVERSDSSRYRVGGFFFRGLDSLGRLNEPADRALYVDGNAVQPSFERDPRWWRYEWEEVRSDGGTGADSVRIRPPMLAGSPLPAVTVTIPIASREGPADVVWSEGEDLRLNVPPVGARPELSAVGSDWMLELADSCSGAATSRPVSVQGRGTHPSELRIPWTWLPSTIPAPMVACLRAFSAFRVSNAPYRVDVLVHLHLTWRIQVVRRSQGATD